MDVRSIADVEPEVEHNGTVPVWYLVHPREMRGSPRAGHSNWSTSSRSRRAARCSRTSTRRTSSTS